jgi:hypothetical protein
MREREKKALWRRLFVRAYLTRVGSIEDPPHKVSNGAVAVRLRRNQHVCKHLRVLPPLLNPLSDGAAYTAR